MQRQPAWVKPGRSRSLATVTKRRTDSDDQLREEARRVIGTATTKDTVKAAPQRQAADREPRLRHVRRLTDLDGIDLADDEVMAGARR